VFDVGGEGDHGGEGFDVAGGYAAAVGADDSAGEGGVLVVLDDCVRRGSTGIRSGRMRCGSTCTGSRCLTEASVVMSSTWFAPMRCADLGSPSRNAGN
jgi:hypothetical protein